MAGSDAAANTGAQMLGGSAWAVALRWCVRGIGLISTLILVRLLTPADFGVVAMGMLVVGAIEALCETRQDLALIQHPTPSREHYDSAWTISVLVGALTAGATVMIAPLTVSYFQTPQAVTVIRFLALRPLISGFENIGVVDFRKGLRFESQFRYAFAQRIVTFAVTIIAAIALRNYWALVMGILANRIAATGLSYAVHPYRPRICLSKLAELWTFSGWAWLRYVGGYFASKADEFVVGGMGLVGGLPGAIAMGRYNVAVDVAASPTDELIAPMVATLFPVMATVQADIDAVRQLFLKVLSWSAVVGCSTSVGVALIANRIVTLALGSQWTAIAAVIPWIALSQGAAALSAGVFVVFDVLGRPKYSALAQWGWLLLLVGVLVPLGWYRNLELVAIGRLVVACVVTPALLWSVGSVLSVTPREIIRALWRPLASAAVMAVAVRIIDGAVVAEPAPLLFSEVLAGAASFVGASFALWRVAGAPAGPEADALGWLVRRLGRSPARAP